MKDVLIYGGGALGRQVLTMMQTQLPAQYKVLGFVDDVKPAETEITAGVYAVGSLESVSQYVEYSPKRVSIVFAIGYSRMKDRLDALHRVKSFGYTLEVLVHPRSIIAPSVRLGAGCIVAAGAIIDDGTVIGEASFIDIGCVIGEECVIGANNYIAAACVFGGRAQTGHSNFFGLNTTIVNDISIGDRNFIAAKSLLYRSLGDDKKVITVENQRFL